MEYVLEPTRSSGLDQSASLPVLMAPLSEDGEERRLRQVHQYLSLRDERNIRRSSLVVSKGESPDMALTAFTQLVAWRLDAQRAIVSLVDREDQYFLAESTQTLDLADTGQSDWLWMGCSGSTARGVALCAQTIKAPLPPNGYACFCVTDLSKNPLYRNLPYVVGPPHFRFYCGTPLVAQDGIRIGSLFVIDDRPREERPSESEINFLGVMASNVMQHLDNQREAEQRKRIMIMSKGLAAFTEGKHRIPSAWKIQNHADTGTSNAHENRIDDLHRSIKIDSFCEDLKPLANRESTPGISLPRWEMPARAKGAVKGNGEVQTHASVLARASNLLRESLDVAITLFLDTNLGGSRVVTSDLKRLNHHKKAQTIFNHQNSKPKSRPATVLSFSTSQSSSSSQDDVSPSTFKAIESRMVSRLLEIYPNGHLWSFNESGHEIMVEDDDKSTYSASSDSDIQTNKQRKFMTKEASVLMNCFPGARQVLYAPIYDLATSHSICACFAVSLKEVTAFTAEVEGAFLQAFLNSVAVEWDRVSVSISNRQKGDFLSSISHEFRSPLHGILASTELLSSSNMEASEKALCETIHSCGQILLNTVSHILDYTKVNDFHRRLPNTPQQREHSLIQRGTADAAMAEDKLSSIALFSDVDVASICESAIQAVCAGNALDRTMPEIQLPSESGPVYNVNRYSLPGPSKAESGLQNSVAVIVDIAPGDWVFNCAPGSIQRIVMNLVGNSLKYTNSGFVRIKIDSQTEIPFQPEGKTGHSKITICVIDTGIGISEDFLRYKLFTPFSQESAFASGTGLGMSMVKEIVQSLDGEISVQSEVDRGTQVMVQFPLMPADISTESSQSSVSSKSKPAPNPISLLRIQCPDKTVAFYGLEATSAIPLKDSVQLYLTEWYHFSIIQDINLADFVIVDEASLEDLLLKLTGDTLPLHIAVLRNGATRNKNLPMHIHGILKPVGPYGLANVLLSCWIQNPARPDFKPELPEKHQNNILHDDSRPTELSIAEPNDIVGLLPVTVDSNPKDGKPKTQEAKSATEEPTASSSRQFLSQKHVLPTHDRISIEIGLAVVTQEPEICAVPLPQARILCVDDNPINLKLLEAFLRKLDYVNVKCVGNGLEAFKMVESSETSLDIIFMDLSMPICDGFESTKSIRKLERQRRRSHHHFGSRPAFIIALTGQASSRDQDHAFSCGMDRFVTKPMSLSHLKAILAKWELNVNIERDQLDKDGSRRPKTNESK